MGKDGIIGGFYGSEVYFGSICEANKHWWNGSGWVQGSLPPHLREGRVTCLWRGDMLRAEDYIAQYRKAEDEA